jgi:hypothetical protein
MEKDSKGEKKGNQAKERKTPPRQGSGSEVPERKERRAGASGETEARSTYGRRTDEQTECAGSRPGERSGGADVGGIHGLRSRIHTGIAR